MSKSRALEDFNKQAAILCNTDLYVCETLANDHQVYYSTELDLCCMSPLKAQPAECDFQYALLLIMQASLLIYTTVDVDRAR